MEITNKVIQKNKNVVKMAKSTQDSLLLDTPTSLGESALLAARAMESYGLDSREIFMGEGIRLQGINNPYSRIPISIMARIWKRAIKLSHDPYIAIRVATSFNPATFSVLGSALVASQNVFEALQRANRYSQVICDGFTSHLQEGQGDVTFTVLPTGELDAQNYPTAVEVTFCSMFKMLACVAGGRFNARAVHFAHDFSGNKKPFEDFFNCPVYFSCDQSNLVFGKQDIYERLLYTNPTLTIALDNWLEEYLARFNQPLVSTKVKEVIFKHANGGARNLKGICRELNIGQRVMQRKLKEEGTSCSKILDEHRYGLAIKHITENEFPLSKVGRILGFSDQSNFTRAFKRWTGTTPHAFRKNLY